MLGDETIDTFCFQGLHASSSSEPKMRCISSQHISHRNQMPDGLKFSKTDNTFDKYGHQQAGVGGASAKAHRCERSGPGKAFGH